MRLSLLQKYILKRCYLEGGKIKRDGLNSFYCQTSERRANSFALPSECRYQRDGTLYLSQKRAPQVSERVKIITQSLERLIARGLMVGYGVRTSEKWFIKEIRLTAQGKKEAKRVLGEQQKLPLK